MFCKKCGYTLEEHASFCPNCGEVTQLASQSSDTLSAPGATLDPIKQATSPYTYNNVKNKKTNNPAKKRWGSSHPASL